MKAVLRFNLDDPDDREDYRLVTQAPALFNAAWDFQSYLRDGDKHSSEEAVSWEAVRAKWHEILGDNGVSV